MTSLQSSVKGQCESPRIIIIIVNQATFSSCHRHRHRFRCCCRFPIDFPLSFAWHFLCFLSFLCHVLFSSVYIFRKLQYIVYPVVSSLKTAIRPPCGEFKVDPHATRGRESDRERERESETKRVSGSCAWPIELRVCAMWRI